MKSESKRHKIPYSGIADQNNRRLAALSPDLFAARASRRHVGYQQAERDCERLAAQITENYSPADIQSFTFVAIPRGGLIVLGMLSYVLGLRPQQLLPNTGSTQPLCIVDDCALTGARFAATIKPSRNKHVVFAHLYSNPELRRQILTREKRVRHCLSARDLEDNALRRFSSETEYNAWRKQWQARAGTERYWIGDTDLVSFAWSEPDYSFWNSANERAESGWRLSPPHLCLKNKWTLGIQPAHHHKIEFQLSSNVVYGEFDGILWLADADTDEVYLLQDIGAEMLRALLVSGNTSATADHLARQYDVTQDTLRQDISNFCNALVEKNLVVRIEGDNVNESDLD